jgi:hypothetical protein
VDFIERDQAYIDIMQERAQRFMLAVALREPPVVLDRVEAIRADKIVNMQGNNAWAMHAAEFVNHKINAEIFEAAKAALKSMMPEDAKICFGHGIKILRDRRGALHVKEERDRV